MPNSKTTLYTVPASTFAYITGVMLANTETGTAYTVNIYLKRSGSTSRRLLGASTSIAASARLDVIGDAQAIRLSAGDVIEGDASTASKIDYFICGVTGA